MGRDQKSVQKNSRPDTISLAFCLGCKERCTFCSEWALQDQYNPLSAEEVFRQIRDYHGNQGTKNFIFTDPAINNDPKELSKLCDLILDSKMKISWKANAIPRDDLDPGFLEKLRKSGCDLLQLGVESGSAKILKLMRKMISPEMAARVIKDCYDAGIKASVNIIVGFPNEGEDDFNDTLAFIVDNARYIYEIGNLTPCLITQGSILEKEASSFDIHLPEKELLQYWYDDKGNDFNLRKKRYQIAKRVISEVSLPLVGEYLVDGYMGADKLKAARIKKNKDLPGLSRLFRSASWRARLMDIVFFGMKESEKHHRPILSWDNPLHERQDRYGQEDNLHHFKGKKKPVSYRRFSGSAGIALNIPHEYFYKKTDLILKIRAYDSPSAQLKYNPARISVSPNNDDWFLIGHMKNDGVDMFRNFTFKVPSNVVLTDRLYVKLDDSENNRFMGYHKILQWIGLFYEKIDPERYAVDYLR